MIKHFCSTRQTTVTSRADLFLPNFITIDVFIYKYCPYFVDQLDPPHKLKPPRSGIDVGRHRIEVLSQSPGSGKQRLTWREIFGDLR